MNRLTVAVVQQRMHLPGAPEEFADDVRRFLRVAQNRQARLVVFPELAGTMTALSLLDDTRSNLLRRAQRGARRDATVWHRLSGSWSGWLAGYLRADMRQSLAGLLDVAPAEAWRSYADLFGGLAREFSMTIVAPSAYLPDPVDGVVRNVSAVFGRGGELLGTQAKVVLPASDADLVQPGTSWDVIQTEVGRIGLILGGDVLYPEVGRLLAYQGADVLVGQAACRDLASFNKVRAGVLARMQDNQLFAVASVLVGPSVLNRGMDIAYAGKSAIFAPQELTPKFNGVLVEMGGPRSEGVVAAEWDFEALRDLWESSDTPIRRTLSSGEIGVAMTEIYDRLRRLPPIAGAPRIAQDARGPAAQLTTLDDLPVLDSYRQEYADQGKGSVAEQVTATDGRPAAPAAGPTVDTEEETDEFDSVPDPDEGQPRA